jgi:hypothetical protein
MLRFAIRSADFSTNNPQYIAVNVPYRESNNLEHVQQMICSTGSTITNVDSFKITNFDVVNEFFRFT